MKHKIRIHAITGFTHGPKWYAKCLCGWEPQRMMRDPRSGQMYMGRPSWGVAFSEAEAHLIIEAGMR